MALALAGPARRVRTRVARPLRRRPRQAQRRPGRLARPYRPRPDRRRRIRPKTDRPTPTRHAQRFSSLVLLVFLGRRSDHVFGTPVRYQPVVTLARWPVGVLLLCSALADTDVSRVSVIIADVGPDR